MQCFPLEAFIVTLALTAFCTFPQRLPLRAGGGWRPAVEEAPPNLPPTSCGPQLPSRKVHLGHLGGHGHSCLMYHELLQPLLLLTPRYPRAQWASKPAGGSPALPDGRLSSTAHTQGAWWPLGCVLQFQSWTPSSFSNPHHHTATLSQPLRFCG